MPKFYQSQFFPLRTFNLHHIIPPEKLKLFPSIEDYSNHWFIKAWNQVNKYLPKNSQFINCPVESLEKIRHLLTPSDFVVS